MSSLNSMCLDNVSLAFHSVRVVEKCSCSPPHSCHRRKVAMTGRLVEFQRVRGIMTFSLRERENIRMDCQ